MHDYLTETKMLDYSNENIKQLIRERKWSDMAEFERLKAIYTFVRDEILFGYNVDDSVPASRVLRDGYGQCNTKGTLLWRCLEPAISRAECMDLPLIKSYRRAL